MVVAHGIAPPSFIVSIEDDGRRKHSGSTLEKNWQHYTCGSFQAKAKPRGRNEKIWKGPAVSDTLSQCWVETWSWPVRQLLQTPAGICPHIRTIIKHVGPPLKMNKSDYIVSMLYLEHRQYTRHHIKLDQKSAHFMELKSTACLVRKLTIEPQLSGMDQWYLPWKRTVPCVPVLTTDDWTHWLRENRIPFRE